MRRGAQKSGWARFPLIPVLGAPRGWAEEDRFTSLPVSPNEKTLASGAHDPTVKVGSASALAPLVGPTPEFSGTMMGVRT